MLRLMVSLLLGFCTTHFLNHAQPLQTPDSVEHGSGSYNKLQISAHRGATEHAPENTLATYRAALSMQVDYIEIDVRTTADNHLVILHDGTLDRTTDGTGPMRSQTLAALKKLSAAKGFEPQFRMERIPTLDEVCQLVADWNAHHPSKTNLYVDCKDVAPEPLVASLAKHDLLTGAVFYGADNYLLSLQKIDPKANVMPSLKTAADLSAKSSRLHPYAFDVDCSALTEDLIHQIHQQGVRVFSDLLDHYDTPDQYVKAARLGVDVIQTDHVLRVRQALGIMTRK